MIVSKAILSTKNYSNNALLLRNNTVRLSPVFLQKTVKLWSATFLFARSWTSEKPLWLWSFNYCPVPFNFHLRLYRAT